MGGAEPLSEEPLPAKGGPRMRPEGIALAQPYS